MDYYSQHSKFYVAVDCIIFGFHRGALKVLLQRRGFEPHAGEWSLMGGFVRRNEDVDDAAVRVLENLTGLRNIYMKQVGAFGSVTRDSGARVVSVAYFALLDIDQVSEEITSEKNSFWADINDMPQLVFDHQRMVKSAHERLITLVHSRPVGFNLLPELFTLTQLQQLYEAILGHAIDKRNFRKRIADMAFIEKTDEIDKVMSRRGAALYRFNRQTFNEDDGQRFRL